MLVPCPSCQRHIKTSPCPFCGGACEVSSIEPAPGLSRAQMLLGVVLTSAAAACSNAGKSGGDHSGEVVLYGAPPSSYEPPVSTTPDAGSPEPTRTPADDAGKVKPVAPREPGPNMAPAYGGPPPTR